MLKISDDHFLEKDKFLVFNFSILREKRKLKQNKISVVSKLHKRSNENNFLLVLLIFFHFRRQFL